MLCSIAWCDTFAPSSNWCKKGHDVACQSKHPAAVSQHCAARHSYSVFIETPLKQSRMAGTDGFSNPGKLSFEPFRANRRVILPESGFLEGRMGRAESGGYTRECTRMNACASSLALNCHLLTLNVLTGDFKVELTHFVFAPGKCSGWRL